MEPQATQIQPHGAAIQRILSLVKLYAPLPRAVLFLGPTGVGKGFFARFLHQESGSRGPFVSMTGGQVSESLKESQLFGHVEGAFTGATRPAPGIFQLAAGGTLFLDEMQHWSAAVQNALLSALGDAIVRPLGAAREVPVSCRLVFAANRSFDELVRDGFLLDLRWRIPLFTIAIPPLVEREAEILPLADAFREAARREFGFERPRCISAEALELLLGHDWPGNLRELRWVVEYGVVHAAHAASDEIRPEHLPEELPRRPRPLSCCRQETRDAAISWMLRVTSGNRSEAARILGLHRNTVQRRLVRVDSEGLRCPRGAEINN